MARATHGHSQRVRSKHTSHRSKERGFYESTMSNSPPGRDQRLVRRCWKTFSVSPRSPSHCFVWRRRHSTLAARASRTICSWAAMTLCCLRPSRISSASCKDQTSRPATSCTGRRSPEPINPRPASHRRRPFPCRAQPSRPCGRGAHGPFRPPPGI